MNVKPPPIHDTLTAPLRGSWLQWMDSIYTGFKSFGAVSAIRDTAVTIDFANVVAHTSNSSNVTLTGARLVTANPSRVIVNAGTFTSGLIYHGYVSADNTVTVVAQNVTASDINPASAVFGITVVEYV